MQRFHLCKHTHTRQNPSYWLLLIIPACDGDSFHLSFHHIFKLALSMLSPIHTRVFRLQRLDTRTGSRCASSTCTHVKVRSDAAWGRGPGAIFLLKRGVVSTLWSSLEESMLHTKTADLLKSFPTKVFFFFYRF